MQPLQYILDEKTPVPIADMLAWAKWFENPLNCIVRQECPYKGVEVSTVFLPLDYGHSWHGDPDYKPVLFETMIFGGDLDQYQERYCTWEEAEAGHEQAVAKVLENRRVSEYLTSLTSINDSPGEDGIS